VVAVVAVVVMVAMDVVSIEFRRNERIVAFRFDTKKGTKHNAFTKR